MKATPDLDALFETVDPFTCRHEGIGLPGCPTCDLTPLHVAAAYRWDRARLQRRLVELESSLQVWDAELRKQRARAEELEKARSDERTLRGIDQRTADKALEYAAEQRKRAEEAERQAAANRAAALQEAIGAAEALLHAEPLDPAQELDRIASYNNGTLRRLIAQLRALQGQSAAGPTSASEVGP